MKRYICFLLMALIGVTAVFAQTVTLTFTAQDADNQYVQLNRVIITNLTRSWQETIYWPDTVLTMQNGVGIDNYIEKEGFALSQNIPNPFDGTTDVNLTVPEKGGVHVDIMDVHGKIVAAKDIASPHPGVHQFRISLSVAGTYVMTARQNGKTASIKMICNGGGKGFTSVEYLGETQSFSYTLKSSTDKPFNFGDMMEYVGYAIHDGGLEAESQRITQMQGSSQAYTLRFVEYLDQLPIVTTNAVGNITTTSAVCGGTVTYNGAAIIDKGICWSTSSYPTMNDSVISCGMDTGEFTCSLTGLTYNTTYYVRAYVKSTAGTVFGNIENFTTPNSLPAGDAQPCPGATTLTDIDGNVYNTVKIGNQCWMKENLRTTRYANGDSILLGPSTNRINPFRVYPGNNYNYVSIYGYLYNWSAVVHGASSSDSTNLVGVQGICPAGWHVPSDLEWNQLVDYVSSEPAYVCGNYNTDIAKALSDTLYWWGDYTTYSNACNVANIPNTNNITGFSILPAGGENGYTGRNSYFWSSTQYGTGSAYIRSVYSSGACVYRYGQDEGAVGSVRCIRGEGSIGTITTNMVKNITSTTASCGGNVLADGNTSITSRGVCWSTSHNPTINDSHTTDGSGTGYFTSSLVGLAVGTIYYIRAYATNSVSTVYGNEVRFITHSRYAPCPNMPTLTDIDNNTYNTIQIGNQCWMKENLRTMHFANGDPISAGNPLNSGSNTTPYFYYRNDSDVAVSECGYLYNWPAVMHGATSSNTNPSGVQGICPTGWHVPSDAEWTQLENYVSNQNQYVCGNFNPNIAKSLVSQTGWAPDQCTNNCSPCYNQMTNNATGFSAVSAGSWNEGFIFYDAEFWSTTAYDENYIWHRALVYSNPDVYRGYYRSKECALSVRCISGGVGIPTVSTSTISVVSQSLATCGGNVISDGGAVVTARGVCWSTSPNPSLNDSHTTNGNGIGGFNSNLTNFASDVTYYVRAYATNSVGTAYGNEMTFNAMAIGNDGHPCPITATVTDYDGNTYNTVQIGNQCWMKENLRTTHYTNGESILMGTTSSNTTPYYYDFSLNNSNFTGIALDHGYLYNWPAVMHGMNGSNVIPSGVQGICPIGWHVPSDTEWTLLTNYVSSQSHYLCGGNSIAKSLASSIGWNTSSNACTPGYNMITNNATGFSAVPAGCRDNYNYNSYSTFTAFFWSSTKNSSSDVLCRSLNSSNGMGRYACEESVGFSVRCVRDW